MLQLGDAGRGALQLWLTVPAQEGVRCRTATQYQFSARVPQHAAVLAATAATQSCASDVRVHVHEQQRQLQCTIDRVPRIIHIDAGRAHGFDGWATRSAADPVRAVASSSSAGTLRGTARTARSGTPATKSIT